MDTPGAPVAVARTQGEVSVPISTISRRPKP